MRIFKLLIVFIALIISVKTEAQRLEIGVMTGVCNYQGDLTPGTARISFGNPHAALGLHAGYELNDLLTVRAKLTLTSISGFDNQAAAAWRLQRNLHFKSYLHEFGVNVEIYGLNIFKFVSNSAFHPFLVTGFNVFRFNPRASYKGNWVELQPLGTEGQGLPEYPELKRYSRTQFSVPIGFGMRYTVNNYFSIAADLTQRWAFTDYLDDVSSHYIDLGTLAEGNGQMAADLSYRGSELGFNQAVDHTVSRGNATENDWYVITNVTFIFKFAPIFDLVTEKRTKCPNSW